MRLELRSRGCWTFLLSISGAFCIMCGVGESRCQCAWVEEGKHPIYSYESGEWRIATRRLAASRWHAREWPVAAT